MAAVAARSTGGLAFHFEEMQKQESDAPEIVVVSSNAPLMENLASLKASCLKVFDNLAEQANRFAEEADTLKKCPSPSWIRAGFKKTKYAAQQRQQADFIQARLDSYKSLYKTYHKTLSPALIEQVDTIERILNPNLFNRLGDVLDTSVTSSVSTDEGLLKLRKKFEEVQKKEIYPITEECESILRLIKYIKKSGKDIFDKMKIFHERLDKLCKTSDSIPLQNESEYVFGCFDPTQKFSSKEFRHLHQAVNELDEADGVALAPVEIVIPEGVETQLFEKIRSVLKQQLELQSQIFETYVFSAAPTNACSGFVLILDTFPTFSLID